MPNLWIDTVLSQDTASGAQSLKSLMTGFASIDTRLSRMTLLRTIIGVDVGPLTHDSGEGSQSVALGIAVASQEAFAAGTVPDPQTDGDFPVRGWVWRAIYRTFAFAADQPAIFTRRIDLDIRAMRKLDNGESYLVTNNAALEGSTHAIRTTGMVRQLWKV